MLTRHKPVITRLLFSAWCDVGFVSVEESVDCRNMCNGIFENQETDDGATDAEHHIDDIVVRGVNGGEPDSEGDDSQPYAHPCGSI